MITTKNVLFVCLDSVRFDTFEAADAEHMKNLGEVQRVHSFACWTLPSIVGYLHGFPPIGSNRRDLFGRSRIYHYDWVPGYFSRNGYATAWLSSNPSIPQYDISMNGGFGRGFKYFKTLKYPGIESSTGQICFDVGKIVKDESSPIFMAILVMDTHRPYNFSGGYKDIDPSDPEGNFENQVKAIEHFDKYFTLIKEMFMDRDTEVIITSDHGELFGPVYWSHDPTTDHLRFDEKLFEIPLVIGDLT